MPKPFLGWAVESFGLTPFPMTLSCPSLKDSMCRGLGFRQGRAESGGKRFFFFKEKLLHFETFL